MLGTGKDMWVSTNEAKDFKKVVAPGMLGSFCLCNFWQEILFPLVSVSTLDTLSG